MSRKWVEKEGLRWVESNIVTREQYERILGLYEEKRHAIGILPILGSILVGLGILSFVAANWQDIPQLARFMLVVIVMVGCYVSGELMMKKGHDKLGIALTALGYISFGAGIVLVAQMFHLTSYDITSFIVWGTAGVLLTFLYRSRFLYLLSLLVFTAAELYSALHFHQFSYVGFIFMAAGLGGYAWVRQSALLTWCFSLSFALHALMFTMVKDLPFLCFFLPVMALYALGDWYKDRGAGYALQSVPLAANFVFGTFMVLVWEAPYGGLGDLSELLPKPLYYLPALLLLFAASAAGKWKQKRLSSVLEWIMCIPFLYLTVGVSAIYLLTLFFFSFYVLWRGYMEEWRFKINFGTVLFICSSMIAYGKLTWDFMDKSLFFIIGGLLLLALSWFLNRRNKRFLRNIDEGEGKHHDR
ncbi:DUF2157 domain-containing protein [Paenibacillus doosanensis]|uniref:DUF2157 domain-containing protein n=1 Tax=Paenibacillus doosanensis TaxID=1229154 RepID=UPI00217F588C|nr:DUF2157 domain-containing protein [Paenibacillus doosanensis]MCS7462650.1 DUF2157 domain-containing protein [Paenibacillus doosanensis]